MLTPELATTHENSTGSDGLTENGAKTGAEKGLDEAVGADLNESDDFENEREHKREDERKTGPTSPPFNQAIVDMSHTSSSKQRLAWADRWNEPTQDQLLEPLKAHHRRVFDNMIEYLDPIEPVEKKIVWYGPSWKWTIHYTLKTPPAGVAKADPGATVCYLVPRIEVPLICLPLRQPLLDELPATRLSKFIKDGIRLSKCAVAIHWCTWTPNTQAEVIQIVDLLKRIYKFPTPAAVKGSKK
jgi:hypothetical protein